MNKKLKRLIDNSLYVSFDIFDTAILRRASAPTDVFDLVEKRALHLYNSLPFKNFKSHRIEAEIKAREIPLSHCEAGATSRNGDVEPTLEDLTHSCQKNLEDIDLNQIYEFLKTKLNLSDEITDNLKSLELQAEHKICTRNKYIYSVYEYCLKQNKKIVFTSDMYLPKKEVSKILTSNGYDNFLDIFLSSETGLTKFSGNAYKNLINTLSCPPNKILHIGDNYKTDILKAQESGLNTYFYEKCFDRALKCPTFGSEIFDIVTKLDSSPDTSSYLSLIVNKYYANPDVNNNDSERFWYDLGYKYTGIMYLGFIKWLIESLHKNSVEKIFFLSRDGYVMKIVYDLISSVYNDLPESHYLYASRRSLHIPCMTDNNDDYVFKYLHCRLYSLKVSQFLEKIDFDPDKCTHKIKQAGFSGKNDRIYTKNDFDKLNTLYSLIYDDLKKFGDSERESLIKYLENSEFLNNETIAVVDIGWGASLQHSLYSIIKSLGLNINMHGYYIGTFKSAKELADIGLNVSGYLFQYDFPDHYKNIIMQCVEFFEFLHIAPHGSVVKFVEQNGKIEPIFDLDCNPEKIKKGLEVQKGAMDFIKDFLPILEFHEFLDISKDLVIEPVRRVLENPTYQEALMIGDLIHIDGHINTQRFIAKPPNFLANMINPKLYETEYLKCDWKQGFTKRWLGKKSDIKGDAISPLAYYLKRKAVKERIIKFIEENKDKKICFYGAGQLAEEFLKIYDVSELDLIGFIDRDPAKSGKTIGNYNIYGIDDLHSINPDILALMILDKDKVLLSLGETIKENSFKFTFIGDLIS